MRKSIVSFIRGLFENTGKENRISDNFLIKCHNFDIDITGKLTRRRGYAYWADLLNSLSETSSLSIPDVSDKTGFQDKIQGIFPFVDISGNKFIIIVCNGKVYLESYNDNIRQWSCLNPTGDIDFQELSKYIDIKSYLDIIFFNDYQNNVYMYNSASFSQGGWIITGNRYIYFAGDKIYFRNYSTFDSEYHNNDITAVNAAGAGSGWFEVGGDVQHQFSDGDTITVKDNAGLGSDTEFTISNSGISLVSGDTRIAVDEATTGADVSGSIDSQYRFLIEDNTDNVQGKIIYDSLVGINYIGNGASYPVDTGSSETPDFGYCLRIGSEALGYKYYVLDNGKDQRSKNKVYIVKFNDRFYAEDFIGLDLDPVGNVVNFAYYKAPLDFSGYFYIATEDAKLHKISEDFVDTVIDSNDVANIVCPTNQGGVKQYAIAYDENNDNAYVYHNGEIAGDKYIEIIDPETHIPYVDMDGTDSFYRVYYANSRYWCFYLDDGDTKIKTFNASGVLDQTYSPGVAGEIPHKRITDDGTNLYFIDNLKIYKLAVGGTITSADLEILVSLSGHPDGDVDADYYFEALDSIVYYASNLFVAGAFKHNDFYDPNAPNYDLGVVKFNTSLTYIDEVYSINITSTLVTTFNFLLRGSDLYLYAASALWEITTAGLSVTEVQAAGDDSIAIIVIGSYRWGLAGSGLNYTLTRNLVDDYDPNEEIEINITSLGGLVEELYTNGTDIFLIDKIANGAFYQVDTTTGTLTKRFLFLSGKNFIDIFFNGTTCYFIYSNNTNYVFTFDYDLDSYVFLIPFSMTDGTMKTTSPNMLLMSKMSNNENMSPIIIDNGYLYAGISLTFVGGNDNGKYYKILLSDLVTIISDACNYAYKRYTIPGSDKWFLEGKRGEDRFRLSESWLWSDGDNVYTDFTNTGTFAANAVFHVMKEVRSTIESIVVDKIQELGTPKQPAVFMETDSGSTFLKETLLKYQVAFKFYSGKTTALSPESDEIEIPDLGAGSPQAVKVVVSGLDLENAQGVNLYNTDDIESIQLYRKQLNSGDTVWSEPSLIYEIANADIGTITTYDDNVQSISYSPFTLINVRKYAVRNIVIHKNRLVLIGRTDLENAHVIEYSDTDNAEAIPASNFRDIESGDGDILIAGISLGDYLYLFKQKKIYAILGDAADGQLVDIDKTIGCSYKRLIIEYNGVIYFLNNNSIYAIIGGNQIQDIQNQRLENYFDSNNSECIDFSNLDDNGFASIDEKKREIRFHVPQKRDGVSQSTNNLVIIYNIDNNFFRTYEYDSDIYEEKSVNDIGNNDIKTLMSDYSGNVYEITKDKNDDSASVPYIMRTKEFNLGTNILNKAYKLITIYGKYLNSMRLTYWIDGERYLGTVISRHSMNGKDIVKYKPRKKGRANSIVIEVSGKDNNQSPVEIEEILLEFNRLIGIK